MSNFRIEQFILSANTWLPVFDFETREQAQKKLYELRDADGLTLFEITETA